MEIRFSSHAIRQLEERDISKAEVEQAIREPEKVIVQSPYRRCVISSIQKRGKRYLLVVIYDTREGYYEIVTAFITSKIKKYL